ncbi:chemotaxis protein CheW [Aureimonas flava]|uniref:Chemotaxis protein CheW n=1 Tax=Aureimonas flava TaxID=2320271 RepID=A0A3A1WWF9_9HYPH|nr:chemotaxis protein CheW [Aureimonas flava]RIY02718.1 chemotaxis protein CheW [Aureimonas flava]
MSFATGLSDDPSSPDGAEEEPAREILTFRLGSGTFGIRVAHVREVLDYKPIAPIPNAPPLLLGMIDVRGGGVPVVDLQAKLRMRGALDGEPTGDSRIVVLDFEAGGVRRTVAVIADTVHEVTEFADGEVEPAPEFGETWDSSFMTGIGRRGETFLTLLDIPTLFETERLAFA